MTIACDVAGVCKGAIAWKGRGLGDMSVGVQEHARESMSMRGDMSMGGYRSLGGDNSMDG